ncbi:hypothetical protein F5X96DRAFT_554212 [Biscogniauxia mediterranea]|nr:hypothetical protein F5X96DRAFT_554212 [Biscogniauxia mediterranea]
MTNNYRPAPSREPGASSYGAKAALLASQAAKSAAAWKPSTTDYGFSAANLAFKSDRTTPRGVHADTVERQKSVLAAKGAVASRQRAKSNPTPKESYPDEANAAANALTAATRAHGPLRSPGPSEQGSATPYTTMSRQMYTYRPPVKSEVDEQKRTDVLHASAVAMAKKMYNQQQRIVEAKKLYAGATASRNELDISSGISDDGQPVQVTTLQDAAYKQAQARLAKMQEGNSSNRDYLEYYGTSIIPMHLFSVRGKLRKRSSSDGAVIEDRKRSQQIRQQMSLFSSKLSEVDEIKRQQDQAALLAAAQRNVHERLKGMDEKITAETGMIPPSTLTQWELKAHAAAQSRTIGGGSQKSGMIDIGAGRFMDQEEINAIAERRVRPVLDEINEKAEKEHARQLELRLEMEKKKEEEDIEKAHQREIQDITKKLRDQDRQEQKERKAEEKKEARAKKEEEKAAKAEQKRLARVEKQRLAVNRHQENHQDPEEPPRLVTINSSGQPVRVPLPQIHAVPLRETGGDPQDSWPKSPNERSPTGRVRTWFKTRFSRGSKSLVDERFKENPSRKSFIGGAALSGMLGNSRSTSLDDRSMQAVAMAGRVQNNVVRRAISDNRTLSHQREPVSPLSSESEDEYFRDEARDRQLGTQFTPPRQTRTFTPSTVTSQGRSPPRDSRFHEII